MWRAIRFASPEHQYLETHARHWHFDGARSIWGDGETVMVVLKAAKNVAVAVIGEDGVNKFWQLFQYSDYFLPEELAI